MATSKKLRRTPKLRTKKTIRTKLKSPAARNLARISRSLYGLTRRINVLVDDFEACHREMLALEAQLKKSGEKMSQQTALDNAREISLGLDELEASDTAPEADPYLEGIMRGGGL